MAAPYWISRSDRITEWRRRLRLAGLLAMFVAGTMTATAGLASPQITSSVDGVEVYATVVDTAGSPVRDLRREDFVLRENGERQEISTFATAEFPLSVAVAVDRSFSMAGERLAAARTAARRFLGALHAGDESMLIAVGSRTEVVADWSRDRQAQQEAIGRLDAFGTTGLHDAIIAAVDAVQPARGRRALVLLSDGSDRYSTASAAAALEKARASDVLIYPIAFGRTRPALFAELATLTGGRSSHVTDARRLPEVMQAIAAELHSQYLLGYSPSRPVVAGSGEWRSITVAVERPGARVRARDGYLVK